MFEKRKTRKKNEEAMENAKNELATMSKEEKVRKLRKLKKQYPGRRPSTLVMDDSDLALELIFLYLLFMEDDIVAEAEMDDGSEVEVEELPSPEEEVAVVASEEPVAESFTNEDTPEPPSESRSYTNEDSYDSGGDSGDSYDSGGDCGCD